MWAASRKLLFTATRSKQCASSSRFMSTTPVRLADEAVAVQAQTANVGTLPPPRRPIGGFRGGLFGFLLGFSLASSFAAYQLLDEYQQASAALQASVLELQASTEKVTAHVKRIEAVEKDLKALSSSSATREELSRQRTEMKKLHDGLHIELLDVKAHLWGVQQDIHALSKKDGNIVRV